MGRFSCAAITNSSITFDFHGDRRIWDGSTIRKKLHGNSALYIIMNEHPNGMCCVRTFEYEYDMCTKFSLLFLVKFSFSTRQLYLFGWIFIFYCACNFEIKVDRNVWKYTEKYWNRTLEILWLQFNLGYTRQGSVLRLINFIIHYPDKCYLVVDHLPSRKLYLMCKRTPYTQK